MTRADALVSGPRALQRQPRVGYLGRFASRGARFHASSDLVSVPDIGERVSVEQDDIGELSGLQRAERVGYGEELDRVQRGGL